MKEIEIEISIKDGKYTVNGTEIPYDFFSKFVRPLYPDITMGQMQTTHTDKYGGSLAGNFEIMRGKDYLYLNANPYYLVGDINNDPTLSGPYGIPAIRAYVERHLKLFHEWHDKVSVSQTDTFKIEI